MGSRGQQLQNHVAGLLEPVCVLIHQTGRLSRSRAWSWPGFFKKPKTLRNMYLCTGMHGTVCVHRATVLPITFCKSRASQVGYRKMESITRTLLPRRHSKFRECGHKRHNYPPLSATPLCRNVQYASPGGGEGPSLTSDAPVFMPPFPRRSAV